MEKTQPTTSGLALPTSAHKPNCKKASAFARSVISANQDSPSCKKDHSDKTVPSCPQLPARDIKLSNTDNRRPASHDLRSLHANNDRAFMGGKGLFLHHMQQAGIPVPPFTVVDTALVARLEQQPFPAKCLLPFLPPINTRSQKSFSLKQLRAIITELPHQQQSEWLKGLSEFIASEDFYQQVKNISAAGDIRHCYFRLRQQANEACIVRSSGVDEDRFGDAQAGRYDSRVHGGGDILKTCLQVLSSAYRPEVCPNGQVKPMALVLQQCIHCRLGGVVISHSTLEDDAMQLEYAQGQPRGAVSGNAGIRPHRYTIRRGDDENSQPDRQFTPGDVSSQFVLKKITGGEGYVEECITTTSNAKDIRLTDKILQQVQKYIEQLENMFYCPVDVEFGVDNRGNVFVFQCRPVTQLPGSTRFCAAAPSLPLAEGTLVSEGYCSGLALVVNEPVSAEQIPPGTILLANHGSDWMLAPDILKRLGGCVFKQGGTNDHIAITLRQAGIPCLVAGSHYSEAASGQQVTLVAGSFSGSPGAYLLTGDQSAFWEASSTNSGQDIVSSPATAAAPPPDFTRVDEGFGWLNRQNNRLLDYFLPDRILSHCLGPRRSKAVSMSANRSDLLQQLGTEIQLLQDDLQLFVSGYTHFLDLAKASRLGKALSEVQSFSNEIQLLKKQCKSLKDAIDNLCSKVVIPLTTGLKVSSQPANFRQWLKDCQTLRDKLQTLTQPNGVKAIHSAHDLIYWLHKRFVKALAPVAKASGQGEIIKFGKKRSLIDMRPQGAYGLLNHDCISLLREIPGLKLGVLNMADAAFATISLGDHVCTISMLEQAEGGKGRTLRLDISDDFSQDQKNIHLQGKLKRFWFLVQTLRCASIDESSRPMAISFNQSPGKLTIECTQVDSTSALQEASVKLLVILSALRDMDMSIGNSYQGATDQWDFETLVKRCQNGLDDPSNKSTYKQCLVLDAIIRNETSFKKYVLLDSFSGGEDVARHYKDRDDFDDRPGHFRPDVSLLDYLESEYRLFYKIAKEISAWFQTTEDRNNLSELRQIVTTSTSHLEPDAAKGIIKELLFRMASARKWKRQHTDVVIKLLREDFDLDKDSDLVHLLVKQNPKVFEFIDDRLKDDVDIAKSAIEQNAGLLEFASDRLRNDRTLVKIAINNDYEAIRYASSELKNDHQMVLLAVKKNLFAFDHVGKKARNDEALLRIIIKENPKAIKFFPAKSLKDDKEFILPLLSREPGICGYLSDRLRSDPDILAAAGYRSRVEPETASSDQPEKPTDQGCSCVTL
ncbi:DUF4116 domain-containing protein [Endozoicomonas sp. 8E]|uniref:DUF4116 domain-containing protein n=1 Tax=Endozoicomonas sp. 8E TaxID=3035692 RepID=UPI0029392CAF|nr:DUF4116 domain-containing protein [Endozoicomonas sp. 8E]WOG25541.1 DUF4116 domain-containing protein [Endozoicomonas sp. 8E]